jgi:peptidoglycan/xylan/chitin deacetylase (PgdA/CDA1 family)
MRPTFIVSIDEELVWGSFDHTSPSRFARENPDLRGTVRELLATFDELRVPATWAMVGHLFLGSCVRGTDGRAHPELKRPSYRWYTKDWFGLDPCTDRDRDPLWYGDDLIDAILGSRVTHEIGCHSFSHIVYGDEGCSDAVASDDLGACIAAARARGITLRSFVFPRNSEGHHALLKEHGFTCYRGEDPTWFRPLPGTLKRSGHLLDQALGLAPPVSEARQRVPGLWNLPGSMLLLHRGGVRRMIPMASRIRKAQLGLERAVRERKIFHLWFHPFNFAVHRTEMLAALRSILSEAVRLRDRGELDICTMGDFASRLDS